MVNRIYIIHGATEEFLHSLKKNYDRMSNIGCSIIIDKDPFTQLLNAAKINNGSTYITGIKMIKQFLDDSMDYTLKYISERINNYNESSINKSLIISIEDEGFIDILMAMYDVKTINVIDKSSIDPSKITTIMYDYINKSYDGYFDIEAIAAELIRNEIGDLHG